MFNSQTVVAVGKALVRVSVTVGLAAVVVPVVIVHEQVWPVPATAVTVALPVDCQPADRANSALVQGKPIISMFPLDVIEPTGKAPAIGATLPTVIGDVKCCGCVQSCSVSSCAIG
jgi:hypothetical protein